MTDKMKKRKKKKEKIDRMKINWSKRYKKISDTLLVNDKEQNFPNN